MQRQNTTESANQYQLSITMRMMSCREMLAAVASDSCTGCWSVWFSIMTVYLIW